MKSTEDKIISAVLSWNDSKGSDSPEDISVMRHHIRAALEADLPVNLAGLIHYPACWDTAAHPTLLDAIAECLAWSGCSTCKPIAQPVGPYGWCISGTSSVRVGKYAEVDAKNDARRCGGTAKAFAVYTMPTAQPVQPDRQSKEAEQRAVMSERFAGKNRPATAEFDLPAPNDSIEQPSVRTGDCTMCGFCAATGERIVPLPETESDTVADLTNRLHDANQSIGNLERNIAALEANIAQPVQPVPLAVAQESNVESFEKWAESEGFSISTSEFGGGYAEENTAYAWYGWQAAPRPKAQPVEPVGTKDKP